MTAKLQTAQSGQAMDGAQASFLAAVRSKDKLEEFSVADVLGGSPHLWMASCDPEDDAIEIQASPDQLREFVELAVALESDTVAYLGDVHGRPTYRFWWD